MRSGPSRKTNRVVASIIVGYAFVAVLGAITSHEYVAFIPILVFVSLCLFARVIGRHFLKIEHYKRRAVGSWSKP